MEKADKKEKAEKLIKIVGNYNLFEVLGSGSFGTVFSWKIRYLKDISTITKERMRDGRRIATKMMIKTKIQTHLKKFLLQEINIMMKLKHENILRLLEAIRTDNNIYIFIEYCNGGDLKKLLEVRESLDEPFVRVIVSQIAKGLDYLNRN